MIDRSDRLNPYLLPDGNVHIAFSGGRTSAFMLHQVLEANGSLDARVEVTFQNTGREMPQTLDFVQEVSQRWGVMVTWLEYRPDAPLFAVVGYQGASREGEPFEALIERKKYLPNQQQRFCTEVLKVLTVKRYLVAAGWKHWTNIRGIRGDELHRVKESTDKRWVNAHPLADAGVTKRDIAAFWKRQPFDLRLPIVKGKTLGGNCDGCFLKSEAEIARLSVDHPKRANWWERMEARATELTNSSSVAFFSKRYSRREMREYMERQGEMVLGTEGALCQTDDGECTP